MAEGVNADAVSPLVAQSNANTNGNVVNGVIVDVLLCYVLPKIEDRTVSKIVFRFASHG